MNDNKVVPIKNLFNCSSFDLEPYGFKAYCTTIKPYLLVIFSKTSPKLAIQMTIPTYQENRIKKIDWDEFTSKLVDCCVKLSYAP